MRFVGSESASVGQEIADHLFGPATVLFCAQLIAMTACSPTEPEEPAEARKEAEVTRVAQAQPQRPNVLLIVADDMGYSDIGSFGGEMPKPFGTGDWELFDLERDPGELEDLSQQRPDKRKELVALWEQYKRDNGVLDISVDLSGVH